MFTKNTRTYKEKQTRIPEMKRLGNISMLLVVLVCGLQTTLSADFIPEAPVVSQPTDDDFSSSPPITYPRILEHPESIVYVVRNEPATLNCRAEWGPPGTTPSSARTPDHDAYLPSSQLTDPSRSITWYRNGRPVMTSDDDPSSHRMILPGGQLFFLRVVHSRTHKPDVGVYYCNATDLSSGATAVSRSASVRIAGIGSEFRTHPRDTSVSLREDDVGGSAADVTASKHEPKDVALQCRPPRGEPEPRVRWTKDSEPVTVDGRVTVGRSGILRIRNVCPVDAGVYVCIASNVAGEISSKPAKLSVNVLDKRYSASASSASSLSSSSSLSLSFDHTVEALMALDGATENGLPLSVPGEEIAVMESVEAILRCPQQLLSPASTIIWKKISGPMPHGRVRVMEDKSLKIDEVTSADEGTYICKAENHLTGTRREAEITLTVHSSPSFLITPQDKIVGRGRKISLRCEVSGNPLPALFWHKESEQTLILAGDEDNGRFSVADDGTLIIDPVQREDAGEYVCKAISASGTAFAKARLDVRDVDTRPPPIIVAGAQNLTLPVGFTVSLPCVVEGDPQPTVRWFKNDRIISTPTFKDPTKPQRIDALDDNTLLISDLRRSDAGLYACKALSDTGETVWTSSLSVEHPHTSGVVFQLTPDPETFPSPPTRPIVSDVGEDNVRLSWSSTDHRLGVAPTLRYTVEYFSYDTEQGWVTASTSVSDDSYTVKNLIPGATYVFVIRAENGYGLSRPSPISNSVTTKSEVVAGRSRATVLPPLNVGLVSEKLSGLVISLLPLEVLSPNEIRVVWEIRRSHQFIGGIHVKYRPILDHNMTNGGSNTRRRPQRSLDFSVETVPGVTGIVSTSSSSYTLKNLRPFTWYEARVQPFYRTVEGQESNTVRARTLEDLPSGVPRNILVTMVDNETLYMSWERPHANECNGILLGYKIFLHGNETRFNRELTLNASAEAVYIHDLTPTMIYKVRIAAFNAVGDGRLSDVISVGHVQGSSGWSHSSSLRHGSASHERLLVAVCVGAIGTTLWFAVCVFTSWLYRTRDARKKLLATSSVEDSLLARSFYKTYEVVRLSNSLSSSTLPIHLHKMDRLNVVRQAASLSDRSHEKTSQLSSINKTSEGMSVRSSVAGHCAQISAQNDSQVAADCSEGVLSKPGEISATTSRDNIMQSNTEVQSADSHIPVSCSDMHHGRNGAELAHKSSNLKSSRKFVSVTSLSQHNISPYTQALKEKLHQHGEERSTQPSPRADEISRSSSDKSASVVVVNCLQRHPTPIEERRTYMERRFRNPDTKKTGGPKKMKDSYEKQLAAAREMYLNNSARGSNRSSSNKCKSPDEGRQDIKAISPVSVPSKTAPQKDDSLGDRFRYYDNCSGQRSADYQPMNFGERLPNVRDDSIPTRERFSSSPRRLQSSPVGFDANTISVFRSEIRRRAYDDNGENGSSCSAGALKRSERYQRLATQDEDQRGADGCAVSGSIIRPKNGYTDKSSDFRVLCGGVTEGGRSTGGGGGRGGRGGGGGGGGGEASGGGVRHAGSGTGPPLPAHVAGRSATALFDCKARVSWLNVVDLSDTNGSSSVPSLLDGDTTSSVDVDDVRVLNERDFVDAVVIKKSTPTTRHLAPTATTSATVAIVTSTTALLPDSSLNISVAETNDDGSETDNTRDHDENENDDGDYDIDDEDDDDEYI